MNTKGILSQNDTQTLVISSFYYRYSGNVEWEFWERGRVWIQEPNKGKNT